MKKYTVKVTYWINTEANSAKEAEKYVEENIIDQQIEFCEFKALKNFKKGKYDDIKWTEVPMKDIKVQKGKLPRQG